MRSLSRRFVKNLEDMSSNPKFKPEERLAAAQLLIELATTATPRKFSVKKNQEQLTKEETLVRILEETNDEN